MAESERPKVLVVDDDDLLRFQFRRALSTLDVDVFEADDGPGAIDTIRKENPDIIFLDILIPGIDGVEVARRARELVPNAKVILMTGFVNASIEANERHAAVFAIVEKPIPLAVLRRFVENAVAVQQTRGRS
ncbi:MAG: response regulator [Alphaproteobacteria bacterium]